MWPNKFVDIDFEPIRIPKTVIPLTDGRDFDRDNRDEVYEDIFANDTRRVTRDTWKNASRRQFEHESFIAEDYSQGLEMRSGYNGMNDIDGTSMYDNINSRCGTFGSSCIDPTYRGEKPRYRNTFANKDALDMARRLDEKERNRIKPYRASRFNSMPIGFDEETLMPMRGRPMPASSFRKRNGKRSQYDYDVDHGNFPERNYSACPGKKNDGLKSRPVHTYSSLRRGTLYI